MIFSGVIVALILVGVICYEAGYSRGVKSIPEPVRREPMGFKEISQKRGGI